MNLEMKMIGFNDLKTATKGDETTAEKRSRLHLSFCSQFSRGDMPPEPPSLVSRFGAHFRHTSPEYMPMHLSRK